MRVNFFLVVTIMCVASLRAGAQDCPEVSLVTPPNSEGGTIYVKEEDGDASSIRYSRAGYLPTGSVVQVGEPIELREPDAPNGPRKTYLKFVSSTGLSGLVSKQAIRTLAESLIEPFRETGQDFSTLYADCERIKAVVMPVSAKEEVDVYYAPINEGDDANAIFTFSRSAYALVVLRDETPQREEAKDGTRYIRVWFPQEEVDPRRLVWKRGYLEASKLEDARGQGEYRIAYLSDFTPFTERACDVKTDCPKGSIPELLGVNVDNNRLIDFIDKLLTAKTCRTEISVHAEFGVGNNFIVRGGIWAEGVYRLPEGEQYGLRLWSGAGPVLYVQTCNRGNATGVREIVALFDWDNTSKMSIHSDSTMRHIRGCFVLASELGPGEGHDRHMVVSLNGGNGNPSYYEAFSSLDRYLRGKVNEDLGLGDNRQRKDRIVAFLHTVLVGWQSTRRSMAAEFAERGCQ